LAGNLPDYTYSPGIFTFFLIQVWVHCHFIFHHTTIILASLKYVAIVGCHPDFVKLTFFTTKKTYKSCNNDLVSTVQVSEHRFAKDTDTLAEHTGKHYL
jgi:hypothetical protein